MKKLIGPESEKMKFAKNGVFEHTQKFSISQRIVENF